MPRSNHRIVIPADNRGTLCAEGVARMRSRHATLAVLGALVLALTAVMLGGCSLFWPQPKPAPPPASQPTSTPPSSEVTTPPASTPATALSSQAPTRSIPIRVYFAKGEKLTVLGRTSPSGAVAAEAMRALLLGPTSAEKAAGIHTQIPAGTALRSVSVANGTATVDLTKQFESGGGTLSMTLRIAQVVTTLTQFPTVKRVTFRIEGAPVESIGGEGLIVAPSVDRSDYESVMPAIMPETPVPGADVGNPVVVAGSANVFEAQFRVRVLDAKGKTLTDVPVRATSGTGTRGAFRSAVAYPAGHAGAGTIRFYDLSAKDGSVENAVDVPVRLR